MHEKVPTSKLDLLTNLVPERFSDHFLGGQLLSLVLLKSLL